MEPLNHSPFSSCGRYAPRMNRRHLLGLAAGFGAASWLTPISHILAAEAEGKSEREPAQSVIMLWLGGGPSQLETFDPHAGKRIADGTNAIASAMKGIQLAEGLPRVAEEMASISLIRTMQSKEGDHERAVYLGKTGYRPDPTVVHPAIGAVSCHELPAKSAIAKTATDIPRHISILPDQWGARGGYLGGAYDAFQIYDPEQKLQDLVAHVDKTREQQRLNQDLSVVERAFARGRVRAVESTLHRESIENARTMMTSDQLKAFDISQEPESVRAMYGATAFGRGCLAARRLIEVGVRCVEITLGGWDSHINNHEVHKSLNATLDPAFAALVRDLRERGLLEKTVVVCGGEFGRTPDINPLGGRDHWPHYFSLAMAGGGIRGGQVLGETDPEGGKEATHSRSFPDVHATILSALGIDPTKEVITPIGRPLKLAEGEVIRELLG
jgi:uncharacterized protein (DUF1501 family)